MFWEKKEPEKKGTPLSRMQDERRFRKIVADNYPGGEKEYEELSRVNQGRAFLRLMDGLAEHDMVGYVPEAVRGIWKRIPSEEQERLVAMISENWLRLERSLKLRGLDAQNLIEEDMEQSMKSAKALLRGSPK